MLIEDLKAVLANDPSAAGWIEAVLTHQPLHAIWIYRLAHWLDANLALPVVPRLLSAMARTLTGVEIHPGAKIGRRFFIDHGTGVVIGASAVIGDDCTMFHNVTLGGTGKHRGQRHPTLGDRVFLGTGATLLGPITVGDDAKIGAGAFIHMRDVPERCTVVGVPARIVKQDGCRTTRELQRARDPGDAEDGEQTHETA
jgi:serine O-acetyltransferase